MRLMGNGLRVSWDAVFPAPLLPFCTFVLRKVAELAALKCFLGGVYPYLVVIKEERYGIIGCITRLLTWP